MVDPGEAQLDLPPVPRAAGIARAFVRDNLPTASDATIDAVSLCVSELVTNALDHATPPFELRVRRDADRLRVEVSDASSARPVPRRVEPSALRGRGLQFIEQIAARWGVVPRPNGKTVWAEFGVR